MRQTAEERTSARAEKKQTYARYLSHSAVWKAHRRKALKRTNGFCISKDCFARAVHVHHIRYPKILGQEKNTWLYPLCEECHSNIHRLTNTGVSLRDATWQIVGTKDIKKARKIALTKKRPKHPKRQKLIRRKQRKFSQKTSKHKVEPVTVYYRCACGCGERVERNRLYLDGHKTTTI